MTFKLYQDDCIARLRELPDGCVDMVMADPPYGTTNCEWDSVIPLEPLWKQLERVCKENAAIVMTCDQPFTSALIASNYPMFRYCWTWIKPTPTGFMNVKKAPLKNTEDVAVFYRRKPTYNPQGVIRVAASQKKQHGSKSDVYREDAKNFDRERYKPEIGFGLGEFRTGNKQRPEGSVYADNNLTGKPYEVEFANYPRQTIAIGRDEDKVHPTQKPVALMAYLIRTYTNPGDTVLDFCMGSGTTGVAAVNDDRHFYGIEQNENFYDIAKKRIEGARSPFDTFRTGNGKHQREPVRLRPQRQERRK